MRDDFMPHERNKRQKNHTITKSKKKRVLLPNDNTKWRKLNFYYGSTVDQLPSHRPQGFQKLINQDNLLNSLFCNPNPATTGKLPRDKDADTDSFMTTERLNRLAFF